MVQLSLTPIALQERRRGTDGSDVGDGNLGVRFGAADGPSYIGNLTNYFTNMPTNMGSRAQAMQTQFGSYTACIGNFSVRSKPVSSPASFLLC